LRGGPKSWNRTPRRKSPSGNRGRREITVVARDQVVISQHAIEVVAEGFGEAPFLVVTRVQDALYLAAESL